MTTIMNFQHFVAFAAAKSATEQYSALDGTNCALAQFLRHEYSTAEINPRSVGFYSVYEGWLAGSENQYAFDPNGSLDRSETPFEKAIYRAITRSYTFGELATALAEIEEPVNA